MSRHPESGTRSPRDFYETPQGVIEPLLAELEAELHFSAWRELRILDAGAGRGVLAGAARLAWPTAHITAIELDREHAPELMVPADEPIIGDFLEHRPEHGYDLVIVNPPFSMVEAFARRALELPASRPWSQPPIVAFLVNDHFLGSDDRYDFWAQHERTHQRDLAPRPSFKNGGSDPAEYAWIIWNGPETMPAFRHYLWRITDKRAKRESGGN